MCARIRTSVLAAIALVASATAALAGPAASTTAACAERDRQLMERGEIDSRLAGAESSLSKLLAAASERQRAVESVRAELPPLGRDLLSRFLRCRVVVGRPFRARA